MTETAQTNLWSLAGAAKSDGDTELAPYTVAADALFRERLPWRCGERFVSLALPPEEDMIVSGEECGFKMVDVRQQGEGEWAIVPSTSDFTYIRAKFRPMIDFVEMGVSYFEIPPDPMALQIRCRTGEDICAPDDGEAVRPILQCGEHADPDRIELYRLQAGESILVWDARGRVVCLTAGAPGEKPALRPATVEEIGTYLSIAGGSNGLQHIPPGFVGALTSQLPPSG